MTRTHSTFKETEEENKESECPKHGRSSENPEGALKKAPKAF